MYNVRPVDTPGTLDLNQAHLQGVSIGYLMAISQSVPIISKAQFPSLQQEDHQSCLPTLPHT